MGYKPMRAADIKHLVASFTVISIGLLIKREGGVLRVKPFKVFDERPVVLWPPFIFCDLQAAVCKRLKIINLFFLVNSKLQTA